MPDIRDKIVGPGNEIGGGTPEQFAAFIDAESKRWTALVKSAGIKVEKPERLTCAFSYCLVTGLAWEIVAAAIVGFQNIRLEFTLDTDASRHSSPPDADVASCPDAGAYARTGGHT